jgi:hypothetical protein
MACFKNAHYLLTLQANEVLRIKTKASKNGVIFGVTRISITSPSA